MGLKYTDAKRTVTGCDYSRGPSVISVGLVRYTPWYTRRVRISTLHVGGAPGHRSSPRPCGDVK